MIDGFELVMAGSPAVIDRLRHIIIIRRGGEANSFNLATCCQQVTVLQKLGQ